MILNRLRWWVSDGLRKLAWPVYDCADCIGMREHGCQCSYYDCVEPCALAHEGHEWLRWLHGFLFPTSSWFWSKLDERP